MNAVRHSTQRHLVATAVRWVVALGSIASIGHAANGAEHLTPCPVTELSVRPLGPLVAQWEAVVDFVPAFQTDAVERYTRFLAEVLLGLGGGEPLEQQGGLDASGDEPTDPIEAALERVFDVWRERGLEECRARLGEACGLDHVADRPANHVILLTDMVEGRLLAARLEPFLRRELEPLVGAVVADAAAAEEAARRAVDSATAHFIGLQHDLLRAHALIHHTASLPPDVQAALIEVLGWTLDDLASLEDLVEHAVAMVSSADRPLAELLEAASTVANAIREELDELARLGHTIAEVAEVRSERLVQAERDLQEQLKAGMRSVEERAQGVVDVAATLAMMELQRLDTHVQHLDEATTVTLPDRIELAGRFALALSAIPDVSEPHYALVSRDDPPSGVVNGGCPDVALGITIGVPLTMDGAQGRVVEVEPQVFANALHHFGVPRALRIDVRDDAFDVLLNLDPELASESFHLAAAVRLRPPVVGEFPWHAEVGYDLDLRCDASGCSAAGGWQPSLGPLVQTSVRGWADVLLKALNDSSRDVALWGFTLREPKIEWRWPEDAPETDASGAEDTGPGAEPILTVVSSLDLATGGDWGSVPIQGRLTRGNGSWVVRWEVAYLPSESVERIQDGVRRFVDDQLRGAEVALSSDHFSVHDVRIDPRQEALTGTLVLPFLDCAEPATTTFAIRKSGLTFDFDLVEEAGDCLLARARTAVAEDSRGVVGQVALGVCIGENVTARPFSVEWTRQDDACEATLTLLHSPLGLRLQGHLRVVETDGDDARLLPTFAAGTTAELCRIVPGQVVCDADGWGEPSTVLRAYASGALGVSDSVLDVVAAAATDQGLRIGLVVKLAYVGDVPVGFLTISNDGVSLMGADLSQSEAAIRATIRGAVESAIHERLASLSGMDLGSIGPVEDLQAAVTFDDGLGVRVSGALRLYGDVRLRFHVDALGSGRIVVEDGVIEEAIGLALRSLLSVCAGRCSVRNPQVLWAGDVPTGVEFSADLNVGFTIPLEGMRITRDGFTMARAVGIPLAGPIVIVPPISLSQPVLTIDIESSAIGLSGDLVFAEGTGDLVKIATNARLRIDPVSLTVDGTLVVLTMPVAQGAAELVVDPFRFHATFGMLPPINSVITNDIEVWLDGDGLTAAVNIALLGVLEGSGLLSILTSGAITVQGDLRIPLATAFFDVAFREGFAFERAVASVDLSVAGFTLASAGIGILPPSTSLSARVLGMGLTVRTPSPRDLTMDRVARAVLELFAFDRLFDALLMALLDPGNVTIVLFTSWGANGDADVGDGDNYTDPEGRDGVEPGNPAEPPYPDYPLCVDEVCGVGGLFPTTLEREGPIEAEDREAVAPPSGAEREAPGDPTGGASGGMPPVFPGTHAVPRFDDDHVLVVGDGDARRRLGGPVDEEAARRGREMAYLHYLELDGTQFLFMWSDGPDRQGVFMLQLLQREPWIALEGIDRDRLGQETLEPVALRVFVDAARMRPSTHYTVTWPDSGAVLATYDGAVPGCGRTQTNGVGYRLLRSAGAMTVPALAHGWLATGPLPDFLNGVRDPRLLMLVQHDASGGGWLMVVDAVSLNEPGPVRAWSWDGASEAFWYVTLSPDLGRPASADCSLIMGAPAFEEFLHQVTASLGSGPSDIYLVGQPARFVTAPNAADVASGYMALSVTAHNVHVAVWGLADPTHPDVAWHVELDVLAKVLDAERETCEIQEVVGDSLVEDPAALFRFLLMDRPKFARNVRAYRDDPAAHSGPPPTCTFPFALLERAGALAIDGAPVGQP